MALAGEPPAIDITQAVLMVRGGDFYVAPVTDAAA
jgi:hypothetical protein